jgi:signal transduction histidine kinase
VHGSPSEDFPKTVPQLEPGLLPALRVFTGLQLVFLIFNFLEFVGRPGPDLHPVFNNLAMTLLAALALAYQCIPRLRAKLGRRYLPIALLLVLAVPFGSQLIELGEPFDGYRMLAGERLLLLLFPLLIVSWQYSSRTVAVFVLASTGLDLALTMLGYRWPLWFDFDYLWTLVVRAAVLAATGFLVARLMREQRRQRAALAEANQGLAQHAATLEELTLARERARMARELHDTLAHSLSALAVQLEAVESLWEVDRPRAGTLLQQALACTRAGLDETRRAIQALRAGPLHERGLLAALRELAEGSTRRGEMAVELELPLHVPVLDLDVESCFYRVAQESLSNVVRHAHATRAALRLRIDPHRITLTTEDDGQGFQPAAVHEQASFGLRGLRERARSIGADLVIESQPGAGTRVRLCATLTPAEGTP